MSTAASELLAKSPRDSRRLTLLRHLLDTEQAASALFRAGTRWALAYPRFFKLGADAHARFLLHLRVASLFHDIGKANEDFQSAIRERGFKAQSLRHEHLSALLLCEPSVARWLAANRELDADVVVAAVLSHHLKAAPDGEWKVLQPRHATPTVLLFNDPQVRDALARVATVASLPPFGSSLPTLRYVDASWTPAWEALLDRADRFASQVRRDAPRLQLTLAVKAGLIACDSVSSGLWREDKDLDAWIDGVAHATELGENDIEDQVLSPRIAELGSKWTNWQDFQLGAPSVGRRGLLLASCGAGKTLAAWRWASSVSKTEKIGRVVFLYPTRGTATEGFRDYVGHAPEGDAALVHGTAEYELAGMMQNPLEVPVSLKGKRVDVDETEARLFALGLWKKRYFSATVDQFLGFIENAYPGLCLLPALADAAVVFDEVHSYDASMWNALVTFLQRFDVPVLCMTATLPPTRRTQLVEAGLRSYPSADQRRELSDLDLAETRARYRLAATTRDAAIGLALAAVKSGQRVLWVVNTVRRCQQLAQTLRAGTSEHVGVYHSRFRLEDRQRRHRETIDAFRAPPRGQPNASIAVTTQVCEMSLDLDADVLITEHAPISSLVQRFGRANRHLRRGPSFRATLLTYAAESAAPYDRKDLDAAAAFLDELGGRDVSQRELAEGLEKHARVERDASGETSFVSGGFYATAGALRDGDDTGASVVLDGDIARFKELERRGEPTDGLRLSVPKKHARIPEVSGLPVWLKTADSSRYDPWLGFIVDDDTASAAMGGDAS
jgi:CRISPR-associated endonuclease/helicase Cas3